MEFVKSKEIFNAIKELDSGSKEAILGALKIAEHIESGSMSFYSKEAEKNKANSIGKFFEFMVKEEEMHLNKILELKKLIETDTQVKIEFPKSTMLDVHKFPAGKDDTTAILYALWREKMAYEFYKDATEKTTSEIKLFFGELAEFELEHVKLFESYAEQINTVDDLMLG